MRSGTNYKDGSKIDFGPRIKITYFSLLEDKKDHDGFPRASAGDRSFVTGSKK